MLPRVAPLAILLLSLLTPAAPAEPAARHGVTADLKGFPQGSPKETFTSVLKAVDLKRIDYLLAQLTDADWVDDRVALYAGGFKELTDETAGKFDPPTIKRLQRFLKEGEFETLEATAVVRLKDEPDRIVKLRKVGDRWFFLNVRKP